jgi:hypothetical protein
MINNIYAIGNTLTLINDVEDITYVSYLIINANRIKYLTDIVNRLTNVNLMVRLINGADACSVYVAGVNDVTDTPPLVRPQAVLGQVWVNARITQPSRLQPLAVLPIGRCR